MKITLENMTALQQAMEDVQSALDDLDEPVSTWVDLDGASTAEEREERRDAREGVEDNLATLEDTVRGLVSLLGLKL